MSADMLRDAAAALVASSCRAQGLPVKVTDRTVLGNVIALLQTDPHEDAPSLHAPDRTHAGGLEAVEAASPRADDSVVKERREDRPLPAQR
jgi:hypothetical protein